MLLFLPPAWILGLAVLCAAGPSAGPGFLPVEEVTPGMRGVGLSVFGPAGVDTFQVEILGVQGGAHPGETVILSRLTGQNLESTGVIAGMSGSPVYIDGRLLGAVASGWAYSKEAIAGITPIQAMLDLRGLPGGLAGPEPSPGDPGRARLWESLWTAQDSAVLDLLVPPEFAPSRRGLETPLLASGFDAGLLQHMDPWLRHGGFLPVMGSAGGEEAAGTAKLEPGGAMAIPLVQGDAQLAGLGTVTWVDGSRIYGLGHPLFNRGGTVYPLSAASIITVLPSAYRSFKIGVAGPPLGAVTRDYRAGVYGEVGAAAEMIPMVLKVDGPQGKREFAFEVLEAERFTSLLIGFLAANAVEMTDRGQGPVTLRTSIVVTLGDGREVERHNLLSGFAPPTALAGEVARTVALIHENPAEPIRLSRIAVNVQIQDEVNAAWLEQLEAPPGPVAPGETLELRLELRDYRGGITVERLELPVPASAPPGAYTLSVCDGSSAASRERERIPSAYTGRDLNAVLMAIAEEPAGDAVVLELRNQSPNPVVAGKELPALPRSWGSIFKNSVAEGRVSAAAAGVLARKEKRMGKLLFGCLTTQIHIEAREANR